MSSARRPPGLLRALLLTGGLSVAACIAPTLPVPPPAAPEVSAPDASGEVTVKGGKGAATAGAQLHVENETNFNSPTCRADPTCYFYVTRLVADDGSYVVKIPGHSKDHLVIYQTVGTTSSGDTQADVP